MVTGTLDAAHIDRLAAHLEECPECEARISALDHLSDPVMSGLRARAGPGSFDKELIPGRVLGDYVLGEELGTGGMGRVFRATHVRMRREVALKVVSRRGMRSRDAARRFAREVEVTAKLVHPNIAIAHDAREEEGFVYLILEYIGGTDLSRLVKEMGPLPIDRAIDYTIQAARGLAYAHARGIVHRDVKPANLMLDGEGVVKVLDLGLSRLRDGSDFPSMVSAAPPDEGSHVGEMTQAGDVLGTVDFVAPEQAQSPRDADHRADVYSLGCTLFYLLTGRSAFARGSTAATLQAHRNDPIPSLRKARPGIFARLEGVFSRMVAKRPDDRFATMDDVVRALRACQVGRAWRARGVASAGALSVLLFAASFWIWHWSQQRLGSSASASGAATTNIARARPPVPVLPFGPETAVRHRDAWRTYANCPETMTNSIGVRFAFIPPGEYESWDRMTVRITRPYYMGVHEVTIGQFRQFARAAKYRTVSERVGGVVDADPGFKVKPGLDWEHPLFAATDDHPALELSYVDAAALARWLSQKEGRPYRVPTMAQWVWAAQAGTPAPDLWDPSEEPVAYGWNRSNSGKVAHPVGQLKPNPWGLYDVRGNAAEWCEDLRGDPLKPVRSGVLEDPVGVTGTLRLLLGSTFMNEDHYAVPGNAGSDMRYPTWGVRLMCEIPGAPSIAAPAEAQPATTQAGAPTLDSK